MRRSRARLWRRPLSAVALTLAALALGFPAAAVGAETVVSLTFDDGTDDNFAARSLFAAHGMQATFYVNTSRIGGTGFLSWAQLEALNSDGHEIAGHTLDHVDLTTVDATEARRQVCDDRSNLRARGFIVHSFAYPYGAYDSTAMTIVRDCGYASGRGAFGLRNITSTTDTRPYAETIPPSDQYAIQTPCCIRSDTPLSALQNYVMNAEVGGGGWVPFVLHRICDGCGEPSIRPGTLDAFLDWLKPRAVQGTIVRTVHQVISGDATAPASSIACSGSGCSSAWYTGPVAVTLSATDAGASGVSVIRYTTDGSEPTVSSPTYTGPVTVSGTTTVKYRAWDNAGNVEATKAQVINIDAEAPTVAITSPAAGATVKGIVKVTASANDAGSGVAAVSFYANGVLIETRTGAPYTVTWNTRKLARGQYTLTAVAEDVARNSRRLRR
jgi:peptidoglycan/xylan/chitin deacetylase (PgdA/CDA1 family)